MAAEDLAAAPPRVLVTRPQPQADQWVAQLQGLGLQAGALPLLDIAGPADPTLVHAAWQGLAAQALVMFVSPTAVDRFFALRPDGAAWPAGVIAAGVGPGTRRALQEAGVPDTAITAPGAEGVQFDSEALWALLRVQRPWTGAPALVVRGEGGREWLADTLRQHGALVGLVEAYRRTVPVPDVAGAALLQVALAHPARHCWLFSSSEAAGHLPVLAPAADWSAGVALATHPRIAEAARRLGFGQVRLVSPSPQAVAEALRTF
jgi:uroporphyrinogen-III synthase